MRTGTLTVVTGIMFAGKTTYLIDFVERISSYGRKRVAIFKPKIDTRSGYKKVMDFHGRSLDAIEVDDSHLNTIVNFLEDQKANGQPVDIVIFDEVQFFSHPLCWLIKELLQNGYDVLACGLSVDFRGEPFGLTLSLLGLTSAVTWIPLCAYCARCGKIATIPQRLIDGLPASYQSPQVLIGSSDFYEPRCDECAEIPGRPTFFKKK